MRFPILIIHIYKCRKKTDTSRGNYSPLQRLNILNSLVKGNERHLLPKLMLSLRLSSFYLVQQLPRFVNKQHSSLFDTLVVMRASSKKYSKTKKFKIILQLLPQLVRKKILFEHVFLLAAQLLKEHTKLISRFRMKFGTKATCTLRAFKTTKY
jgi:hypothetical protein